MIILVDPRSNRGAGKGREICCTGAGSEQSSFGKRLSAFFDRAFCRSVWLFATAVSAIAVISVIQVVFGIHKISGKAIKKARTMMADRC